MSLSTDLRRGAQALHIPLPGEGQHEIMYFAYGSNMDQQQMRDRGVAFSSRIPATLTGYRLAFNKQSQRNPEVGFANVVRDPKSVVEGALYRMPAEDIAKLDKSEGYPRHYAKAEITVRTQEGKPVRTIVYIATPEWTKEGLVATKEYVARILGGRDLLSPAYVQALEAIYQKATPEADLGIPGKERK